MTDAMTMIHADRTRNALVHGGREPWVPSPETGVERRMLERIGGEVALATSIVRYAAHSRFSAHVHTLGEEFLVLEGTFSDEHGHYPAGTYVRNPAGSRHAPFSDPGCVIFVKLRQMHPADARSVRVFERDHQWLPAQSVGHTRAVLHKSNGVTVQLERLIAGAQMPLDGTAAPQEVFVVDGSVELIDGGRTVLERWAWLRRPRSGGADTARIGSSAGALLWTKRGHLEPADDRVRDR
jgi:anti-sigma factor ChrR (cupin superfamily)